MKLNILPRHHLAWQSPYYLWYGKHNDFSKSPFLPFGCRIRAHTPASIQTKLSHNAQLHYYVGSAPFHKAGIMLYNPKTKQTIIRHSFTQLDSSDPIIPSSRPTHHIHQSLDIFPSVPDISVYSSSPDMHISNISTFYYGHCPLFLFILLYFIIFPTNLLTIFVTCLEEFSFNSASQGPILCLITYLFISLALTS